MSENLIFNVKKAFTPYKELKNVSIVIEEGKIKEITDWKKRETAEQILNFENGLALPGFIDIHVHGYGGFSVMGGKKENFIEMSKSFLEHGVTSFLPSTVTQSQDSLFKACEAFRRAKESNTKGAEILGIHLEGPYFKSKKAMGAQNYRFSRSPDINELEKLNEASGYNIKRITLSPEIRGSKAFIQRANDLGIVVAAGHTDSSYKTAIKSFKSGIRLCNHLFNGMKGFHHRKPGIIGACLTEDDVYAEMIADLVHLHPATIDLVMRAKGIKSSIFVTDAIPATGLSDGEYQLGGREIVVKEGVAKIKKDGRLAGSTLTMDKAMRNMMQELDYGIGQISQMMSTNPANLLSLPKRGKLSEGYRADITILNSQLEVILTVVNGEVLYRKG